MNPCQFIKIVINNLAIRFTGSNSFSACYCKIKLCNLTPQSATIPILLQDEPHPNNTTQYQSTYFNLSKSDTEKLLNSKKNPTKKRTSTGTSTSSDIVTMKLDIYYTKERKRNRGCGFGPSRKLLGRVIVPLELSIEALERKYSTFVQNGWVLVGGVKKKGLNPEVYMSVKVKPDPRFVFRVDGEPECSPQVFQVHGNIRQPVFTCKFSCRQGGDFNSRSSSEPSISRSWINTLKVEKDRNHRVKERKGWSITIHDLSGSPVATASMVTPFVPSKGSDQVSRSNPGAWLILRPGDGTWKPWGRLESWRECTSLGPDKIGHKFELIPDAGISGSAMGPSGVTLAQGSVPARAGGKFSIDIPTGPSPSPSGSPNNSFDFNSWAGSGSGSGSTSSSGSDPGPGWVPGMMYKGFVMSTTIGGEYKRSKQEVEIGAQHVTCTEDAAVFVALAAAMDLSVDACRPFSHKLRKELRHTRGKFVV